MDMIERDYEIIIKGLTQAEDAMTLLLQAADKLDQEADAAANELKDRVGKKDIKALKDLAAAIKNAVNSGPELGERIRELKEKMEKQNKGFEELDR